MTTIVSDWHLNRDGLWENAAGWVCRRQHAASANLGIVWVGYRPATTGDGDYLNGRPTGGWGEVWAHDLDTLMQRVDQRSGAWARIEEHAPGLVPTMQRRARSEAWEQLTLGEWIEAA